MFSLQDLKDYDIKNIDLNKIIAYFRQRRDALINLIIILLTIFALFKIIDQRNQVLQKINSETATLDKKVKAISDFETAKNTFSKFLKELPESDSDSNTLINKVNNMAIEREIQITSFEPASSESTDYYTKTTLRLTAKATSYPAIGNFINDIETANYNLLVENLALSGVSKDLRRSWDSADDSKPIQIELKIASIDFKR